MSTINENNFKIVQRTLQTSGITNKYAQAAILATIWKESAFTPKDENMNYSKERLPEVWGRFSKTGEAVPKGQGKYNYNDLAVRLAHKPYELAEEVYGGRYGNTAPGDGYKFRGRGFNGITFKDQYKLYADLLKIPLVEQPELLNEPTNAARANVLYFLRAFRSGKETVSTLYGAKDINDFNNYDTALKAFTHANAGWKAKQWVRDWSYNNAKAFLPEVQERLKGSTGSFSSTNILSLITAGLVFAGLRNLI